MKTRWLIYILLGVFLSSCYKEENIEGEEDEPKYKVEDSEDPLDHFIYGFYHDYGVFILYDYEEVDYRWNMSTVLDVELIKQTDKVTLNEGWTTFCSNIIPMILKNIISPSRFYWPIQCKCLKMVYGTRMNRRQQA